MVSFMVVTMILLYLYMSILSLSLDDQFPFHCHYFTISISKNDMIGPLLIEAFPSGCLVDKKKGSYASELTL